MGDWNATTFAVIFLILEATLTKAQVCRIRATSSFSTKFKHFSWGGTLICILSVYPPKSPIALHTKHRDTLYHHINSLLQKRASLRHNIASVALSANVADAFAARYGHTQSSR